MCVCIGVRRLHRFRKARRASRESRVSISPNFLPPPPYPFSQPSPVPLFRQEKTGGRGCHAGLCDIFSKYEIHGGVVRHGVSGPRGLEQLRVMATVPSRVHPFFLFFSLFFFCSLYTSRWYTVRIYNAILSSCSSGRVWHPDELSLSDAITYPEMGFEFPSFSIFLFIIFVLFLPRTRSSKAFSQD